MNSQRREYFSEGDTDSAAFPHINNALIVTSGFANQSKPDGIIVQETDGILSRQRASSTSNSLHQSPPDQPQTRFYDPALYQPADATREPSTSYKSISSRNQGLASRFDNPSNWFGNRASNSAGSLARKNLNLNFSKHRQVSMDLINRNERSLCNPAFQSTRLTGNSTSCVNAKLIGLDLEVNVHKLGLQHSVLIFKKTPRGETRFEFPLSDLNKVIDDIENTLKQLNVDHDDEYNFPGIDEPTPYDMLARDDFWNSPLVIKSGKFAMRIYMNENGKLVVRLLMEVPQRYKMFTTEDHCSWAGPCCTIQLSHFMALLNV